MPISHQTAFQIPYGTVMVCSLPIFSILDGWRNASIKTAGNTGIPRLMCELLFYDGHVTGDHVTRDSLGCSVFL